MNKFKEISALKIPSVDSQTMYQLELLSIEFNLDNYTLMQNASKSVFNLIDSLNLNSKNICILSGKGNNGADGLATTKLLSDHNFDPFVIVSHDYEQLNPLSKEHFNFCKSKSIPIYHYSQLEKEDIIKLIKSSDLIVDALLGIGASGNPKEPIASLIRLANESKKPILSIDIPSGLSLNKGKPSNPTIKATHTITLGLPKKGLYKPSAKKFVGDLYFSDLDIPQQVFDKLNIDYKSTNNQLIKLHL